MNLRIDLAWILAVAQQIPGDPQIVDYRVPVAAEARHRAEILDHEVYPEPHHKAAALLCELARNPSLEMRNLLFAASAGPHSQPHTNEQPGQQSRQAPLQLVRRRGRASLRATSGVSEHHLY